MELLVTHTILVSVRLSATEIGEVILKECPFCFAVVREARLADHVETHSDN